jgi:hypothetical protein
MLAWQLFSGVQGGWDRVQAICDYVHDRIECRGTLRSLRYQPIASDFIGSALTCASWISLHLVHRRVQCSNPERAEVICWTSMRDWHLGQRDRAVTRGDKVGVCGSGMDASR